MHRFLTGKENEGVKPVYGLTSYVPPFLNFAILPIRLAYPSSPLHGLYGVIDASAILIEAAKIGFDTRPAFDQFAPQQHTMFERIRWEVLHGKGPLRRAIEVEGLWDQWEQVGDDATARAKL